MKAVLAFLLSLIMSGLCIAQEISYPERERSSFQLTIEGIDEEVGEIRIAIFDSESAYNERMIPFMLWC